jgi:hypothetical protein
MEIVNISEMSIENSTGKFWQFTVTSDHSFTEPVLEVTDFEGATEIETAVSFSFSKTLVHIYQTTRCHIPYASILYTLKYPVVP